MKKTIQTLLLFAVLTLAGCAKECEPFYTGKNCKERITDAYVGNYTGTLIGANGSGTETFTVENGAAANEITFATFKCVLQTQSVFNIPNQTRLVNNNLVVYNGSGIITATNFQFTLYVNNDPVLFSGSRQ